jgi:hypothetical protein
MAGKRRSTLFDQRTMSVGISPAAERGLEAAKSADLGQPQLVDHLGQHGVRNISVLAPATPHPITVSAFFIRIR